MFRVYDYLYLYEKHQEHQMKLGYVTQHMLTLLGRLPKVDLIILEGGKMSVRPSVHKKFLRFQ